MNITVVGSGYVGLVTGACLAEVGNEVVCVDNDAGKINGLRDGKLPLFEPGLEQLVTDNAAVGRLTFTTDIKHGVDHGEVIFIAVGTPPQPDGAADLRNVFAVAAAVGEHLNDYRIVAIKSTVPVGTSKKVCDIISAQLKKRGKKHGLDADFNMVANPEFLKQGAAVEDCMKPDRIIVGATCERAFETMRQLYAPFNRNRERMIAMDIASAELTKYAANAMLATRISLMNELANLAERLDADIESVRAGIGADPRIGYAFIYPGCGYGGSCFPKDIRALQHTAAAVDYDAQILRAVDAVNDAQKQKPLAIARKHFDDDLKGKRIALWGLAFKPDTDDMREAPSRAVLEGLFAGGATVHAFDPAATAQANKLYAGRDDLKLYADDPYDALADADALIVVTEWRVLRATSPARIKSAMRGDVVIDGRNLFEPARMRAAGLTYYGIGRG